MDIRVHPVWEKVNLFKKQGHLLRIKLARQYAKFISPAKVVGIAGSVGKTTTTQACLAVLEQKYNVIATKPNLDPIFNIPITLLKTKPNIDKILLEMGIEYLGEMDFYLSLIKPKTAIITRLSIEHSEFLGELSSIIQEESKLVTQLPKDGLAILNWDDENTRELASKSKASVVYYGFDAKNCQIWASKIRLGKDGTTFKLSFGKDYIFIKSKLIGVHQIYSLLAAAALGVSENISLPKIKVALELVKPPLHRMNLVKNINGSIILDDTYNSSPAAITEALNALKEFPGKRKIAVLGDMLELGKFSKSEHQILALKIIDAKVDLVILGQGNIKSTYEQLLKKEFNQKNLSFNLTNAEIIEKLKLLLQPGDVVLIKASRSIHMEVIVEAFNLRLYS